MRDVHWDFNQSVSGTKKVRGGTQGRDYVREFIHGANKIFQ